MTEFRMVALDTFVEAVSAVQWPPRLNAALERIDRDMLFRDPYGDDTPPCAIHDGDLIIGGSFVSPAPHILVTGNIIVDGLVDTACNDADGGSFFVTGNVTCSTFIQSYEKAAVIGGDLIVRDFILNAYSNSLLYVGGSLRTHFFLGHDIWAEVGGEADMDYGIGYCLPFNHQDASAEMIEPLFGEDESWRHLLINNAADRSTGEIASHLRTGRPLFRQ